MQSTIPTNIPSQIPPPDVALPIVEQPAQPIAKPAIEALPPIAQPEVAEVVEESKSYSGLYAKKSGKPLKQVYGHIDRISQGEIGSLLERYSDRFGHELDRDIIVMRKEERDEKIADVRDSPTVELLNLDEEDETDVDGETLVELNLQLETVETELRRLKPEYQAAKEEGDRDVLRELRPILEELMAERKLIKAVISGEADIEDLTRMDDEDDEEDEGDYDEEDDYDDQETYVAEALEDGEDIFLDFVAIVDTLLGSNLPEDKISEFTKSDGFQIYRQVGSDPEASTEEERAEFFSVVDALLGGMPDSAVSEFVASADFETYREIGAMYS
tara:strand:+ start:10092 stop:11081 length:990 start_codon:yes stop_codon:yes gene_type:complete